jgi:hypothetical protein
MVSLLPIVAAGVADEQARTLATAMAAALVVPAAAYVPTAVEKLITFLVRMQDIVHTSCPCQCDEPPEVQPLIVTLYAQKPRKCRTCYGAAYLLCKECKGRGKVGTVIELCC